MKYMFHFYLILFFSCTGILGQELALVREKVDFGYIDKDGTYLIKPQFKKARSFSNGLAGAEKNGLWGFINPNGEWTIKPIYKQIKDFYSGYALVLKDDSWRYIDKQNNVLNTPKTDKYYTFQDGGIALFKQDDKIGLFGINGKIIVNAKYQKIQSFVDGHAIVKSGDLYGMINLKGEVTIPFEYQALGDFNAEGIWAHKNKEVGLIINGLFKPVEGVSKIWNFHQGSKLAPAKKGRKVGFISNQGEWVIEPNFDEARNFNKGLAPVRKNSRWGIINEAGEMLIPLRYEEIKSFSNYGLAAVKFHKWGFINTKGEIVIPTKYEIAPNNYINSNIIERSFNKGLNQKLLRVKYSKKWGYFDLKGNLIGNKWFKNAEPFESVK